MLLDRLARGSIDVDLWFLTDGRVRVDGLEDRYAGPVSDLSPAVPRGLASLLDGPYLTRVSGDRRAAHDPRDFVAVRAAADSPFRATVERVGDTARRRSELAGATTCWLVLAAGDCAARGGRGRRMRRTRS